MHGVSGGFALSFAEFACLLRMSSLCTPFRAAAAPWAMVGFGGLRRGKRHAFFFWKSISCWSRIWWAESRGFWNVGATIAFGAFSGCGPARRISTGPACVICACFPSAAIVCARGILNVVGDGFAMRVGRAPESKMRDCSKFIVLSAGTASCAALALFGCCCAKHSLLL